MTIIAIYESLCTVGLLVTSSWCLQPVYRSGWKTVMMNWMNMVYHSSWFITVLVEEMPLITVQELVYWRCWWCWGKTTSPGCRYWWIDDGLQVYGWHRMMVDRCLGNTCHAGRCPISGATPASLPNQNKPKNPQFGIKPVSIMKPLDKGLDSLWNLHVEHSEVMVWI